MPNKPFYQPHFPCHDADQNKPITKTDFANEAHTGPYVFWADVPEYDYIDAGADNFGLPYTRPETWPRLKTTMRLPRCVRFMYISVDEDDENAFAIDTKAIVETTHPGIFFQQDIYYTLGPLAIPNKREVFFDVGPSPNPGDGGAPYFNSIDPDFIANGCILFGEVLNFLVFDINAVVFSAAFDGDGSTYGTFLGLTQNWDQIRDYSNAQYLKQPKSKTIVQQYPDQFDHISDPAFVPFEADTIAAIADDLPNGWEMGPDFAFDRGYMLSQIRDFWSL